jgi:tRNA(Ile)-lysidine synthase
MINLDLIKSKIPFNCTFIVGFSGGPDSVFLLTILAQLQKELNLKIIAAHLDHQWRGNSHEDALWCKKFCQDVADTAFVSTTSTKLNFAVKNNGSAEEVGRILRRQFFSQLAQTYQADHIVLAHHADDQIETFFIRLMRGSGITGLAGIQEQDGLYLRPLLHMHKQEILNYLHEHKITYLTDPTNIDTKYLRNNIRKKLIPTLQSIDHRSAKNILSTMQILQDTDQFLTMTAQETLQKLQHPNDTTQINTLKFLALHVVLQHKIILELLIKHQINFTPSASLFAEILRFLHNSKSNQHQIHTTSTIVKNGNYFSFKSL